MWLLLLLFRSRSAIPSSIGSQLGLRCLRDVDTAALCRGQVAPFLANRHGGRTSTTWRTPHALWSTCRGLLAPTLKCIRLFLLCTCPQWPPCSPLARRLSRRRAPSLMPLRSLLPRFEEFWSDTALHDIVSLPFLSPISFVTALVVLPTPSPSLCSLPDALATLASGPLRP